MRALLYSFLITLSLCTYPVFVGVSSELSPPWFTTEWDIFNWLRMVLVFFVGAPFLSLIRKKDAAVISYLVLLLLSFLFSHHKESSIYGTPEFHEGLLAILGYVGIFLLARKVKCKENLEKAFTAITLIVFIVSLIGIYYGNYFNFPPIKAILPKETVLEAIPWPLYSTLGAPNHLGLFCSLLFPYFLVKRKWVFCGIILFLLIGSQTRAAWLSVFITTLFISRKNLAYLLIIVLVAVIPIREKIIYKAKVTLETIHFPMQDKDFSGRGFMWSTTLPIIKNNIFLGNSPGTFPLYFPQRGERKNAIGFRRLIIDRPHNMYLNVWFSSGLLSLVILLGAILNKIRLCKEKELQMAAIGFLIAGIFTDSVLCVTPYFAAVLGTMGVRNEHAKKRRHVKRNSRAT